MKLNFLLIVFCLATSTISAQMIQLLADINPGTPGSAAFNKYKNRIYHDGKLFFAADDGVHGTELWIYQNDELSMVKDINEGAPSSDIEHMYIVNNKLIFFAVTPEYGKEWWTSDGTEAGTQLLVDIVAGSAKGVHSYFSSDPNYSFHFYNNELYFTGLVGNDKELWKTDGTANGTTLVKDVNESFSSNPSSYTIFDDELYFSSDFGLYKTDGTSEGTILIRPDDPDSPFYFRARNLTTIPGFILMNIDEKIWVSDGTQAGTNKIYEFESSSQGYAGKRFYQVNGTVLFAANDGTTGWELWKTNGTAAGTQLVKDVWPGSDGFAPQNAVIFNDKLYYKGDNGESDVELFVSDGTLEGTMLFYEFHELYKGITEPSEIVADENYIYLRARKSFDKELWVTDGIASHTIEINLEPNGSSHPSLLYPFDGKLFCFVDLLETGFEPHIIEIQDLLALPINPEIDTPIINIYPNPVSDIIQIDVNGLMEFTATIFDINGKSILSVKNKNQIYVDLIPTGTYLLEVTNLQTSKKVSKQIVISR